MMVYLGGRGAALNGPLLGEIFYHWHSLELLTHCKNKKQADFQSFLLLFLTSLQQSTIC